MIAVQVGLAWNTKAIADGGSRCAVPAGVMDFLHHDLFSGRWYDHCRLVEETKVIVVVDAVVDVKYLHTDSDRALRIVGWITNNKKKLKKKVLLKI